MSFPTVLVICDSTSLITALAEELKDSNLTIIVITKNKKHFNGKYKNKIYFLENVKDLDNKISKINYLIYFKNNSKKDILNNKHFFKGFKKDVQSFRHLNETYKPKSVFVLYGLRDNFSQGEFAAKFEPYSKKIKEYGSLILYGDLVSSNEKNVYLSSLFDNLLKASSNKKIEISRNNIYYPLFDKELTSFICKLLFSMKSYGKAILIIGRPLKAETLIKIIKNDNYRLSDNLHQKYLIPHDEKTISKKFSKKITSEVFMNLRNRKPENRRKDENLERPVAFNKDNKSLNKNKIFIFRYYKKLIITLSFFVFLFPPLLTLTTLGSLYFSRLFYDHDYLNQSITSAKVSLFLSHNNNNFLSALKKIPVLRDYYNLFTKSSLVIELQSESAVYGLKIIESYSDIFRNIYLKENNESENNIRNLVFDLEVFYQKLGFLESETTGNQGFDVRIVNFLLKDVDLHSVRQKTILLKEFTQKIPLLVGSEKPLNYVLIFQNNSTLRPTGGRIETVSIVDFIGFRIVGNNIEDVSWYDKNLQGKIEPPEELNKYFGIENWYLRDSNWNPDFPSTASQVEYFLDKRLDLSLEGLIAIDMDLVNRILKILNENKSNEWLGEYYKEVKTTENYPEDTNEYFFTYLLKNISTSEKKLTLRKITKIVKEIYAGFNSKNIQMFVKNNDIQRNLSDLGWDGSFGKKECIDPCFSDFVSLIESTQEGNSLTISREAQLSIYFQEGIIKRKLTLYIENQNEETYKAYFRIFTNTDVGFSPVSLVDTRGNNTLDLEIRSARGLKEAGVFLEIKPKESIAAIFAWEGSSLYNFNSRGEYNLFWRKQAGLDNYPIEITILMPEEASVFTDPNYSLTKGGVLRYNTSLDRDFFSRVFW